MKVKIHVTKEILERSKMCVNDSSVYDSCAFALAVKDIFPKAKVNKYWMSPFGDEVYGSNGLSIPDGCFIITEEMTRFITEFDYKSAEYRSNMKPQSFELVIPDWVIEKIGISEAKEIIEKSKTIELV